MYFTVSAASVDLRMGVYRRGVEEGVLWREGATADPEEMRQVWLQS